MSDEVLLVAPQRGWARVGQHKAWRAGLYLVAAMVIGALAGLLWAKLSPLPSYRVLENFKAFIDERGQVTVVAADIYFAAIVAVLGLAAGIVGWLWFQRVGWMVLVLPLLASLLAAVVCWQIGVLIGPSGFTERIAQADIGDVVVVDLQLRAYSALLVAPFAAITPVMLLAAFSPEPRASSTPEVSFGD